MTNVTTSDLQNPETDVREQLWNDGKIGPIGHIQLPVEAITSLNGVFFDLDPKLFRKSLLLPVLPDNPEDFYDGVVKTWLGRHPTLAKAEVRMSGTGLHIILRFGEPVIFNSAAERTRWAGIVQVVQAALPIDPDQPGIIATTRPIGSINGKNGQPVELLAAGQPVTADDVMTLYKQMVNAPFRTVLNVLAGQEDLRPCPVCGKPETRLAALDYVGKCYGSCGKVGLDQLYDVLLEPHPIQVAGEK